MPDPKVPPSAHDDQSEDLLFDRDFLSDSDSEFLAELDRVLEAETIEQTQEPGAEGSVEERNEPELESELSGEDVADDTAQPADQEVSAAEDAGEEIDEITASAEPVGSATAQAGEAELGGIVEPDAEPDDSSPTDEAPEKGSEPRDEEGKDSDLLLDEEEAKMDEADTEPLLAAAQIPEPPPPWAVAAPASEAAGQKPRQDGSSPLWVGAAALLALIGIAVGAAGLWQAGRMGERLSGLESALKPTTVPEHNPGIGESAERIAELEQRLSWGLARLSNDLNEVKSALDERLESEKARLNEDLSGLNSTLTVLQGQLESAEEMVARADKRLQQAEQKPARVEPPAQPKAVPAATPAVKPAKPVADPQRSAAKAGGKGAGWTVNLQSFKRRDKAEQELARIRGQDIPAEIFTVSSNDKVWHRIAVGGFGSFDQAKTYAQTIRSKPGLAAAWVGRN